MTECKEARQSQVYSPMIRDTTGDFYELKPLPNRKTGGRAL